MVGGQDVMVSVKVCVVWEMMVMVVLVVEVLTGRV